MRLGKPHNARHESFAGFSDRAPSVPEHAPTHLRAARTLAREHCRSNDVPYVETGLFSLYWTVIRYLNRVGLAARDPFECPLASRLRRPS